MYFQLISFALLALIHLSLTLLIKENTLLFIIYLLINLAFVIVILGLLFKILRKNNQLEIMDDKIKLNNVEVSNYKIEKIIIQGYFIQSLGIKLYGKRFILNDLHFRFENNEDMNVEDFKKWADHKGIDITSGRIYRWL